MYFFFPLNVTMLLSVKFINREQLMCSVLASAHANPNKNVI